MTALDPTQQPGQGMEAQKLISISLGKMAASRVGKNGTSLHKSLLVASVLQRARHVFLEENYHSYQQYRGPTTITPVPVCPPHVLSKLPTSPCPTYVEDNDENRCSTPLPAQEEELPKEETTLAPLTPVVVHRLPLGDASNVSNQQQQRTVAVKRRRVTDKETQDAVSSILPKRLKCCESYDDEDTTTLSPLHPCDPDEGYHQSLQDQCAAAGSGDTFVPISVANNHPLYSALEPISDDEEDDDDVNSMEVEHITSLVSIFSFGAPRKDLCSTQVAREDHSQFTPVALTV